MATATISIGRGGAGRRLSDIAWGEFSTNIIQMLNQIRATVFVNAAESIGEWEGVSEESRTWVADIGDLADFVTGWLELSAAVWEQDAIAFTVGETTLVTPPVLED